MPKAISLSEEENVRIQAYTDSEMFQRDIVRRTACSNDVMRAFLRNPAVYNKKKTCGVTKKLFPQDKMRLAVSSPISQLLAKKFASS